MDLYKVEEIIEECSSKNNWVSITTRYHPEIVDLIRPFMVEISSSYPNIKDSFLLKCFFDGIRSLKDVPLCEHCMARRCSMMKMGNKFNATCSKECRKVIRMERRKETNLEKYGVEHAFSSGVVKERISNTMKERYGVSNPQQCAEVRKKTETTMLERYGVLNASQSSEIRKKAIDTLKKNYGVCVPAKSEKIRLKTIKTNHERYGGASPQNSPEIRKKIDQTNLERYGGRSPSASQFVVFKQMKTTEERYGRSNFKQSHYTEDAFDILNSEEKLIELYNQFEDTMEVANFLGCDRSTVNDYLNKYGMPAKRKSVSHGENKVAEFVESLGFSAIRSDRTILKPYEADIVVPDRKLIIEYNGVWWHSEEHKPKKYHQEKSLAAHQSGYEIVHVWEDDWMDDHKRQIVKNKIKAKLGVSDNKVYARKTTIKEPTKKEVRALMDSNHIQGFVGYTHAYGLYEGESLVACLTLRKTKETGIYDLNRFATSKTVVGGMSKLLSFIKNNLEFREIFTYAHLDYSSGSVYEKSGFEKKHITPPGMWYVKKGEDVRVRRERFMKHKLTKIFGDVDMSKTEAEIMNSQGYYRVYDAGSIKYTLT